jgi:hypothetical protein
LVNTISITGGAWNTATYDNVNTDVNNTYYEYGLSIAGEQVKENYYIAYNWTTRKWFDTQPTNHHNTFGTSSTDLNTTSRETTENPAVVYVFDTSPRFTAQFTNPYYEPPTVVSPLPVLSQHTQAFGMEYYQTVGTKYYYKSDSHSGTGTSITYDYETKTWNDEGSQVPYHLNTTSTFASTTSLVNPAEIHGFGSQQNHNGTRYFSVSNPYYEAPAYRTGTAIDFTFSGGSYQSDGYTPIVDDIATSSGEVVGTERHWKWDIRYQNTRYNPGSSHWLIFVPGTTTSNGVWTAVGGGANDVGTRNGTTITCGIFAIFDETNAFVDGLVPYGDIP